MWLSKATSRRLSVLEKLMAILSAVLLAQTLFVDVAEVVSEVILDPDIPRDTINSLAPGNVFRSDKWLLTSCNLPERFAITVG